MKINRAKILSTTALIAVLVMQLFWMWNTFEMTVHQMGYASIWGLTPNARIEALLSAFMQSRFTVFTSILTTIVIILSIIDQINYIDEQERIRLLREDFSYAMVHDMKSPLTSIIMGTRYLHSGVLEKKPEIKEKYFAIVEDEAQHLLALINRLLTISKLEHGKLTIRKTEVDLEEMIADVADKYEAKSSKPIHITTDIACSTALADEEYLKEAISNMVDNATKYSKDEINIKISTSEDDHHIYIKVYDEGIGIAKSELKTIFNRYERAAEHEKNPQKTRGGFGIGLNYVLQVIQAHGGKISVKSEKGKYSEFTISLPKYLTIKTLAQMAL
uniref:sensor histidine kinase n=1 Tax=Prevotella sp. TaxID=59823 RepID=UPI0025CFDA4D|nr:HAMP domain-containing sensor histidine kinase [Prevotella sp.]